MAGEVALPGGDIPRASMVAAMVLAVNRPAQEPSPGHATHSSSYSSSSVILPAWKAPTASKTSWMVTSRPWKRPGMMVPP